MLRYIIGRLILSIPTLLAVFTIVFFVVRVLPGDPAQAALGDFASEAAVAALREGMGLNEPILVQYTDFLGGLLRGDLGRSLKNGQEITSLVGSVLPHSIQLTVVSLIVGLTLGVPIGIITAVKRNSLIDYAGRILSLGGLSLPAFYLGVLIVIVFAVQLDWFPSGGATPFFEDPMQNIRQLILPALTLGLIMTAYTTRLTRSAMLNVLNQDYIGTARSKGLMEQVILTKHGLRSAALPIVAVTGLWAVGLIGDSVLTEVVFSRPGLGSMLVGAILQKDYNVLQSLMVVYAVIVVVINLLVDLTYGALDPRISH